MKKQHGSIKYEQYLKELKQEAFKIKFLQISFLVVFIGLWEWFASIELIDDFFFSKPSAICNLLMQYTMSGDIFMHLWVSVYETILGLVIGTILGLLIAIILWWSERTAKILDPFLVILNALPKTALAPILIVWVGAGMKGIVVIAIMTSVVVTILSAYSYFQQVDPDKIKLLQSFGASKYQMLTKLILPSNYLNLINVIKINIGMSWVGVIVGEFIVSRAGIGYLIVYGGQVFRLDIVMMGVLVLGLCAYVMYAIVSACETRMKKKSGNR